MKVTRTHGLTKQGAKSKVEDMIPELMRQYGGSLSEMIKSWEGDEMRFSFIAAGMSIKGIVSVGESDVVLDMPVPLMLRPFESRIRAKIEEEIDGVLTPLP